MRVLITGASGFIGSHLSAHLIEEGHEVWGFDNLETGRARNWSDEQLLAGKMFILDIAQDRARFYELANELEPELVIHCAASYSDPNKWHRDTDTNVSGTINAINVARHHNAKLIYFQTALPPISSYAISKIAGEQYIKLSGVPHLIFRLSNIYGPRNLSGPIPAFYKRLAAGEPCTVVETVRDMVYIDDLVECVMGSLERDGTYDVCSGRGVPIGALYEYVALHFPNPRADYVRPSYDDVMPQTSVHEWPPDWSPKTKLQDGVDSAVTWYSENGVDETFTHLALKG